MNDRSDSRKKTVLPPARLDEKKVIDEADQEIRAENPSASSDRRASVRETLTPDIRHGTRADRGPFSRLQRKPARARDAPPPARGLTNSHEVEMPSRQIEVGDEVWTVLVKGSATVGSGRGQGARLLSIGFEAPGARPSPEGTRYLVANQLEDVDEDVLRGLVAEVDRNPGVGSGVSRHRKPRGRGRFRRPGR